jgi:hypothetical protein
VERADRVGGGRREEMGEDGFSEAKHACATARRRWRRQQRYLRWEAVSSSFDLCTAAVVLLTELAWWPSQCEGNI